jgi:phospholipid/cholesterol/gamma-HCH transport system substrate-binding protein
VKISNETKVGILATIAIVIIILGVNFLKGKNVFSKNINLYAKYPDVDGLAASNAVMMHGLKVGQVDDLELMDMTEGENRITVKFHIYGDVKIADNSVAKIISSDLLGSKAIEIIPGNGTELAGRNDTLPGTVELSLSQSISKVVAPVQEKIEKLVGSVDTIVTGLNSVFNENTKSDLRMSFHSIKESLQSVEHTTQTLDVFVNGQTGKLADILANVNSIASNIKQNNGNITRAINNFSSITDSLRSANLKQTLMEANSAVTKFSAIVNKIERGEGSVGLLMNDRKLYDNLQNASKNLDRLVVDLKQKPGRYLHFSIINRNRNNNNTIDIIDTTAN